MTYDEKYSGYKLVIEKTLGNYFISDGSFTFDGLMDSMSYSLMAGGKRIRPVLVLEFCRLCGGNVNLALPTACAIEMFHTYTLIHDDLPCMDDDDLRRGKPTNHVKFGECTAVLAGDALQAEAFGTILRSKLDSDKKAKCAEILANAAGVDGVCGGQFMDMLAETEKLAVEELHELQSRKTGALLIAACTLGVAAAGGTDEQMEWASMYGAAVGAAFQIRDDMLDVLSTDEVLGKPVGSDEKEGKQTFMTVYGEQKCREMVEKLSAKAIVCAKNFENSEFLVELVERLAVRDR